MNTLQRYTIPYKELGLGNHHFEFQVDDCFFDAFEGSEYHKGHALVSIELQKQSQLMKLDLSIEGGVEVICDRCLEPFEIPFRFEDTLQVRFCESEQEGDGEVMWISPKETDLALGQYIYESICLSLPYRKIHPEDAAGRSLCSPEMLARFRVVTQEEFDRLTAESLSEESSRQEKSPWKELETLKTQLEEKTTKVNTDKIK